MVAAIFFAALGTAITQLLQRFILKKIDAYTQGWFFGGGASNNTDSSSDVAPEPAPVGSCPNDLAGEGDVRVTTAAGFYYFAGLSVVLMLAWLGLWVHRQSILKHERHIAWQLEQREKRGRREKDTFYMDPFDAARMNTVPLPLFRKKSATPKYLHEEPTCAEECASFLSKQLGGWPGFLLFASLATASFLYADTFRTYERVVVQQGGLVDWLKSYIFSMPQKAIEVEGWKWATSLAFSFVSGVVRDWWYDIVKGAAIPVAGYTANVVRKTYVERKISNTAKKIEVPAEALDEQHVALRREVSSSAAAAARFRRSRDPQTAQPVKGVRKMKQWVLARVKSFVHSANGRAATPAPTSADKLRRANSTASTDADAHRDPVGYAKFQASVVPPMLRPMSAADIFAERFEGASAPVGPGPAPSAPPASDA